jgi:hypothetical protein
VRTGPRLLAPLIGRYAHSRLQREEESLAAGHSYEPASFCEKNAAELLLEKSVAAARKPDSEQLPSLLEPVWRWDCLEG